MFTNLGTLGGVNSYARGINDSGEVCGYSEIGVDGNGDPIYRAFQTVEGKIRDLGTLGFSGYSWVWDNNNSGNAVGVSNGEGIIYSRSRKQMIPLQGLGWGSASPFAVNDSDVIVGSASVEPWLRHAALWRYDDTTATVEGPVDLGNIDEFYRNSMATAISRAGHVAGEGDSYDTGKTAFLWRDGVMTGLGRMTGMLHSTARGVNSDGIVVGYAYRNEFPIGDHRGFVYKDGSMQSLTTQTPGWEIYEAYAINDNGQIVAWGRGSQVGSRMLLLEPDQAPTAQNDSAKTAGNTAVAIDVLSNDSDPEGDALQVTSNTLPSFGSLTRSAGVFTYTPNPWAGGPDSFAYTIDDGYGATSTATVNILVTAANVTSQVSITQSTLSYNRKTGRYTQTVTIKKSGSGSVPLPMSLAVDGLTDGVTLVGAAGATVHTAPAGSPYVHTSNGGDGLLSGKDTVKVTLTFNSPTATINYTLRTLSGAGPR